jgi:DUF1009 family protein
MGRRIGIIAGSGKFVPLAVSEMTRKGQICVVAGIEGEASSRLEKEAEVFSWLGPGEAAGIIRFFRQHGVSEVMMLGKVRPAAVLRNGALGGITRKIWDGLEDRSPTGLLKAAVLFLEANGLRVLSPLSVLEPHFCEPGVLTKIKPTRTHLEAIDFGLKTARKIADLDIGQTLVIKDRLVVAVEGAEGTDETIRRGFRIAGPGCVVVKAGRTSQDMRLDVPAVGLDTVRSLIRAESTALALEAGKVAFFQRDEAVSRADAHGIAIIVREL